jgi:hypothetical protein
MLLKVVWPMSKQRRIRGLVNDLIFANLKLIWDNRRCHPILHRLCPPFAIGNYEMSGDDKRLYSGLIWAALTTLRQVSSSTLMRSPNALTFVDDDDFDLIEIGMMVEQAVSCQ